MPTDALPVMNIYQSNLLFAVRAAIIDQRRVENAAGFSGESALLAGWIAMADHIQKGGQIEIIRS